MKKVVRLFLCLCIKITWFFKTTKLLYSSVGIVASYLFVYLIIGVFLQLPIILWEVIAKIAPNFQVVSLSFCKILTSPALYQGPSPGLPLGISTDFPLGLPPVLFIRLAKGLAQPLDSLVAEDEHLSFFFYFFSFACFFLSHLFFLLVFFCLFFFRVFFLSHLFFICIFFSFTSFFYIPEGPG